MKTRPSHRSCSRTMNTVTALAASLVVPALALGQITNFIPNSSFEASSATGSGLFPLGIFWPPSPTVTSWTASPGASLGRNYFSPAADGVSAIKFVTPSTMTAGSALFPTTIGTVQYVLAMSAAAAKDTPILWPTTHLLDFDMTAIPPSSHVQFNVFQSQVFPAATAHIPIWWSRAAAFNYAHRGPSAPTLKFSSEGVIIDDAYLFETHVAAGIGPAAGYVGRPGATVTGSRAMLAAADSSALSLKSGTKFDDSSKFLFASYVGSPSPSSLSVNVTMKRSLATLSGSANARLMVFDWVNQRWVEYKPGLTTVKGPYQAMSTSAWTTYSKDVVYLGSGSAANFVKAIPDLSGNPHYVVLAQVLFYGPYSLTAPLAPNPPFEILIDRAWAQ